MSFIQNYNKFKKEKVIHNEEIINQINEIEPQLLKFWDTLDKVSNDLKAMEDYLSLIHIPFSYESDWFADKDCEYRLAYYSSHENERLKKRIVTITAYQDKPVQIIPAMQLKVKDRIKFIPFYARFFKEIISEYKRQLKDK